MPQSDQIGTAEAVCDYLQIPWPELRAACTRLHDASRALGDRPHADLRRVDVCHSIRLAQDQIFASNADPLPAYTALVDEAARFLAHALPLASSERPLDTEGQDAVDVTAKHYGQLWGGFSSEHYFDEATELLRQRFVRNDFDLSRAHHERVIDIGCGGGRYSVALKRLGFKEVVGIDWSEQAIGVANARVADAKIAGVSYMRANVLDLPFADGEFDVVFSNGVLHHTVDCQRGLDEFARVVKPGGRGWLYLYHRPGGLDRLTHYMARLLLKHSSHEVCRRYCRALNLPANRIFFLLDLWLTPIADCYTPAEMDTMLASTKFTSWRRCERGMDLDLVERIHQQEPYAEAKYGVGENRYILNA